jgi:hypothetical protein
MRGLGRMTVTLQPVSVDTGSEDHEGCLVFTDGRLAAVLVRLSDQHSDLAGQWHYEHGFDCSRVRPIRFSKASTLRRSGFGTGLTRRGAINRPCRPSLASPDD